MHDYRKWEIESGIPPERRLRPEELIARTADPADALITSLLLNRDFKIEIPDEDAEKITTVQNAIDYANTHQKA